MAAMLIFPAAMTMPARAISCKYLRPALAWAKIQPKLYWRFYPHASFAVSKARAVNDRQGGKGLFLRLLRGELAIDTMSRYRQAPVRATQDEIILYPANGSPHANGP